MSICRASVVSTMAHTDPGNFSGSTTYKSTINTASLIIGTIFAPNHNLIKTGTGDIDGGLFAKSIILGLGEIHLYNFVGNVPSAAPASLRLGYWCKSIWLLAFLQSRNVDRNSCSYWCNRSTRLSMAEQPKQLDLDRYKWCNQSDL